MKRSFVCLLIVLVLSLMLAGCSGRMDGGMVTSSPAAVSATPVVPSMEVNLTPEPDHTSERDQSGTESGNQTDMGTNASSTPGISGK